ncbi:DNA-3-methyladenine glycosylase 2 family protein [Salinimonas marina]|uniref:DNA-3-methyladenine glycosylase 2 family protein n=1 Tax=Salinimonas marina TaxID=2785918 RepID=A0A7S9DYA9_9ALTE|nr:Ada metal-binding domain-containing protein [Salinimonas marina]QPG05530.1 DNA-3-methyladenine glycosylase 2 family protein [Salinimonas marina]
MSPQQFAGHSPQQLASFRQARLSRDPRFDGTFFVAVTTTGIFCRPVCPARLPAEHNVLYYAHALQAMAAGFRPCLRCRPDSAPQSSAWQGIDTTIKRAQQLLSRLPAQNVGQIATRLGISSRYLHQLTTRHLGLTPKQIQIYQQLLFAKQLLQQSALTVTEVALACGFQSSRRLQIAMQKHWGLTPRNLRRTTSVSTDTPVTHLFLACRTPYNWAQVQEFLAVHALPLVEQVSANSYQLVFNWDQHAGRLKATYNASKNGFDVELELADIRCIQPVMQNLARVLDVNADPQLIKTALLNAGIASGQLVEGLRLPGTWSYFEAGCRAVLGQQISVKAATNYANQLVAKAGQKNQFGWVFPGPEAVANMPLTALRLPASRQTTLHTLACAFVQHQEPPGRDQLLALKGIGPGPAIIWKYAGLPTVIFIWIMIWW